MDFTTALGVMQPEIMGRCWGCNQLPCAQSAKLEFCLYTHGMKFYCIEVGAFTGAPAATV
jgi:hypothetical protein